MNDAVAAERAHFFRFLLNQPPFSHVSLNNGTVLDFAFGSGNLVTHLVLESEIDYQKLTLNDKINSTANQFLAGLLDRAEVSAYDFLEADEFDEGVNAKLIVFNPQTGGKGDRASNLESIVPTVYAGELQDYLISRRKDISQLTFTQDDADREILVHSETLTKVELKEMVGNIAIFNYYDVFWQSKNSRIEGSRTNIVQFRKTFDKVFDPQGIVVFYGELPFFRSLFADFNHVAELCAPDEGKNLFVAIRTDGSQVHQRYQKQNDTYVPVDNCQGISETNPEAASLDALEVDIDELMKDFVYTSDEDSPIKLSQQTEALEESLVKNHSPFRLSTESKGKLDFPYRNILLKGVPGTGKSRLINESFIKKKLNLASINDSNVLRINVHSASSNADLMQGIGITSVGGQIEYREKQGLILKHLQRAIAHPYQPFAIVLEEIQENSLNELIGDLIYLIEDVKRVDLKQAIDNGLIDAAEEYESPDRFLEIFSSSAQELHYVEVPYLVSTETRYKKMIIPVNLYLFCTSNYRDDKKVIEDNLLRRFDVIEVYPKYKESVGDAFAAQEVSDFLKMLNEATLTHFKGKEIHPDRFMIGHAIWLDVSDAPSFCRALLKTITEFKDVRELDYHEDVEPIFGKIETLPFGLSADELLKDSYQEIINTLQQRAYGSLLDG